MNKIAAGEKNINTEIFNQKLKYQNPSLLVKGLHNTKKTRYGKIVNHVNDAFFNLRNVFNKKKSPEN